MKPFKVVCINVRPIETENWIHKGRGLVKGNIYTVLGFSPNNNEIPSFFISELNGYRAVERFRPVQDIGGSVEEHINKLIKEEDLKTISV